MALHLDKDVLRGLLYCWIRDAQLLLDDCTAERIRGRLQALESGEGVVYSHQGILDFIDRHRLAGSQLTLAPVEARLIHRLRQLKNKDGLKGVVIGWREGALHWESSPVCEIVHLTGDAVCGMM